MSRLITADEAKKLVSGSEERKNELILKVNDDIQSQAERGLRFSHLPLDINNIEKDWLKDNLILAGFTIKETHPQINW